MTERELVRHPLDRTALIWGIVFVLIAVVALAGWSIVLPEFNLGWLVGTLLVFVGIWGLARALRR